MIQRNSKIKEKVSTVVDHEVLIGEPSLEKLINIYHFRTDAETLTMYDRKREKTVIAVRRSHIDKDDFDIFVDGEWLLREALTTKLNILKDILKKEFACRALYNRYLELCKLEHNEFVKMLEKWQLGSNFGRDDEDEMD